MASQNKQFNQIPSQRRQADRRGHGLSIASPRLGVPRNREVHPKSYLADVFLALYRRHFPA